METIETKIGSGAMKKSMRSGRLIAKIGSARILRGHDGFLDIYSDSPGARNAALAWMFAVNPSMFGRLRRCEK